MRDLERKKKRKITTSRRAQGPAGGFQIDADSIAGARARNTLKLAAITYVNARHAVDADPEMVRAGYALLAQAALEYHVATGLQNVVRIEVRAAEIAAQMFHEQRHDMTAEELAGWRRSGGNHAHDRDLESPARQAGWLAAIIWSHERGRVRHRAPATAHRRQVNRVAAGRVTP